MARFLRDCVARMLPMMLARSSCSQEAQTLHNVMLVSRLPSVCAPLQVAARHSRVAAWRVTARTAPSSSWCAPWGSARDIDRRMAGPLPEWSWEELLAGTVQRNVVPCEWASWAPRPFAQTLQTWYAFLLCEAWRQVCPVGNGSCAPPLQLHQQLRAFARAPFLCLTAVRTSCSLSPGRAGDSSVRAVAAGAVQAKKVRTPPVQKGGRTPTARFYSCAVYGASPACTEGRAGVRPLHKEVRSMNVYAAC
jgi:hypothetical protein